MITDIKAESKVREETQSSVIELLTDTINRVKQEIDVERKERNESQDTILMLLEKQCSVLGSAQGAGTRTQEHMDG
jgi:hypothetical protein